MADKLPPNWEDIKTRRTVLGQSWADIQKAYNVPLSTLKNRASKEGWKYEAAQIGTEIRAAVTEEIQDDLKALCEATLRVHRLFMERMLQKDAEGKDMIKALDHAFLTDGERVNSLFQTAMNNSVKILQAQLKNQEDEPTSEEETGFVGLPGIDADSL